LAPAEREALEPHLVACVTCRQKIEHTLEDSEVQRWRRRLHQVNGSDQMRAQLQQWRTMLARSAAEFAASDTPEQDALSSPPTPAASVLRPLPATMLPKARLSGESRLSHRQIGRYTIERELGQGGMGVVYLGYDPTLKRHAAIKMLLAAAHARLERRERFLQEAAAVARLHHPHIVQVYEIGHEQGEPFLAMEFIDGVTLQAQTRHSPQPPHEAAALVRTLAQAVHHAHQAGIIHRDLKPTNILLQVDSDQWLVVSKDHTNKDSLTTNHYPLTTFTPKIVDFGLAKQLGDTPASLTGSNDMLGTPDYMAPELAAGDRSLVGPTTDIYSLGAILYELLTGRPPFQAPTPMETLIQVRVNEPVPPRRLQPGLERDLETICLKCLEKEPHRRYLSAADLAADLHNYLDGRAISARRITWFGRAFRWCRRNRTITGLTAALFLGTLMAGDLLLWQTRQRAVAQAQAEQQIRDALVEAAEFGVLAETAKEETILRSRQRAAVERAAAIVAVENTSPELAAHVREQLAALDQNDADYRLLSRLDEILIKTYDSPTKQTDRITGFCQALAEYGIVSVPPPEVFSQRLRAASPRVRLALLGALDRWSNSLPQTQQL
jgi:predicted Ser/Thr protein kinase